MPQKHQIDVESGEPADERETRIDRHALKCRGAGVPGRGIFAMCAGKGDSVWEPRADLDKSDPAKRNLRQELFVLDMFDEETASPTTHDTAKLPLTPY
jgi:hypothetical protein